MEIDSLLCRPSDVDAVELGQQLFVQLHAALSVTFGN